MTQRQLKAGYFILAALNTLATCYFSTFIFFFLRDRFGFGNRDNLWVSALNGFIYIFSAWQCGRFAQRRGFLTSLKVGFSALALVMIAGGIFDSIAGMLLVVTGYSVVLLFTWPALEALVSENETQAGVQHMVGIYNTTWASAAAFAYFTGGRIYDWSHRGEVFWLPAALFTVEFLLVVWLSHQAGKIAGPANAPLQPAPHPPEAKAFEQPVTPRTFLRMAWVANPFAYVAINTLIAVMPGVGEKFDLSTTQTSLLGSVWFFARLAAFVTMWQWTAWHYRFRWLLGAFIVLTASFVSILITKHIWMLVIAEIFFGFAVGLIYYSSLFYSMDVGGETQGEHGGLHEAAIGVGIFAGPAVGAASLQFFPRVAHAGVYAVSTLLLAGLCGLVIVRQMGRTR